jgi:hypothetical protein
VANTHTNKKNAVLRRRNLRFARSRWGRNLGLALERSLAVWSGELRVSIERGDLLLIEGVVRNPFWSPSLARRKKCSGIHVDFESELYELPRNQVLRRDSWRCQLCGTMSNLEIHHQEFRSHSGDDSEQNLITLCSACHASVHHC